MIIRYNREMYFDHRSLVGLIFEPADLKCETVDAPILHHMTFFGTFSNRKGMMKVTKY